MPASSQTLVRDLVRWFRDHRRDLPWRTARTPYRVWLSEVMLQQTRVAVVEDYFRRFVARFPDVRALAAASEDEVLSSWSGLGYYSRGRNLHKAARAVVDDFGGAFPSTSAGLRALPGVGAYTAAAVASLAFGERVAVVDGNVARVLARLHADATPVDTPAGRALTTARAQALVDADDVASAGDVNEALMELGALVCTPRSPSCGACPWGPVCAARAQGDDVVRALPVKAPKRARTRLRVASVVVVDGARVWLEKRASRGLFGGLHEPPSCTLSGRATGGDGRDVADAWRALLRERALPAPRTLPPPIVVERTLTHRDLSFAVLRLDVRAREHPGPWVDDVRAVGVSSAVRAVLDAVRGARDQHPRRSPRGSQARAGE